MMPALATIVPESMASSKQKRPMGPPKPYQKTPLQLQQWAKYLELCALREEEAKVRKAIQQKEEIRQRKIVEMTQAGEQSRRANELRNLREAVCARIPTGLSPEVQSQVDRWVNEVSALADSIDPIESILHSLLSSRFEGSDLHES